MSSMYMYGRTTRERLLSRLVVDPESGCLLWTGCCYPSGYGQMRINGRGYCVHRVAWELERGPIPEGLVIDHVKARGCRHRNCANVAHLEPVTIRENVMRTTSPHAINAAKDRCDHGHEFDLFNTSYTARGRRCKACHRDEERRRRDRARGQAA